LKCIEKNTIKLYSLSVYKLKKIQPRLERTQWSNIFDDKKNYYCKLSIERVNQKKKKKASSPDFVAPSKKKRRIDDDVHYYNENDDEEDEIKKIRRKTEYLSPNTDNERETKKKSK